MYNTYSHFYFSNRALYEKIFESPALAGMLSFHSHQKLAQGAIQQPLVAKPYAYPNQTDVKEGKDYIVDVVFAVDPLNFFCQFVDNTAPFNDLMERLATVCNVSHFHSCKK